MPLYEYECYNCGGKSEEMRPIKEANKRNPCIYCGLDIMHRVFSVPNVFIGIAGCVEGRGDEFWNRAEKKRQKELKQRKEADQEKLRYNDKKIHKKLERAIDNRNRINKAFGE